MLTSFSRIDRYALKTSAPSGVGPNVGGKYAPASSASEPKSLTQDSWTLPHRSVNDAPEPGSATGTTFPRLPGSMLPGQAARFPGEISNSNDKKDMQAKKDKDRSRGSDHSLESAEPICHEVPSPNIAPTRSFHLDGSEPKLMPGMISRAETTRRRNSLLQSQRSRGGQADGHDREDL